MGPACVEYKVILITCYYHINVLMTGYQLVEIIKLGSAQRAAIMAGNCVVFQSLYNQLCAGEYCVTATLL